MTTKVAAIGSGYWGPNLIRNFAEMPDCELVAVADLDPRRLEFVLQRFPQVKVTTTDYRQLFDLDIDAVVISTPPHTHHRIATQCLEMGLDVLVEKPMTTSVLDAQDLIDTAARHKRVLMVGHTFVYNEAVRELKRMMTSGELGDIRYVDAVRVGLGLYRQDLNVIWDLAPHDISILLELFGTMPDWVTAQAVSCMSDIVEDVAYTTLMFPSSQMAHVRLSWLDPNKTRRLTVVGSEKMVIYDDVAPNEKLRVFDKGVEALRTPDNFGEFQFNYRYGDIVSPYIRFQEPLRTQAEHFIECIEERKAPITDGGNGLAVVSIIESMQKSLQNRGEVIPITPVGRSLMTDAPRNGAGAVDQVIDLRSETVRPVGSAPLP